MNNDKISPITDDMIDGYKTIIHKNLIRMRAAKGYKQADIADLLRMTASGYGDYERRRCPESHILLALANLYDIPVSNFFLDVDENGAVINENIVKGAFNNPIEKIANSVLDIAKNTNSSYNDRLLRLEARIAELERLIYSGKSN